MSASESNMKGQLQTHFYNFVRRLAGTEVIDDLPQKSAAQPQSRADIFFQNRAVIAELKRLETDTEPKIQAILEPFSKTKYWPLFVGERPISQILPQLPDSREIHKKIYNAVAGSLEYRVRDANGQIRLTKESFGLPDAKGILIVLNDTIDVLDPNVMAHKFGQTLLKTKDGGSRYPYVGCVWLLCETHTTTLAGPKTLLSIVITNPRLPDDPWLAAFMDQVQLRWAEFNGMTFHRATMEIQNLNNIPLNPVRPTSQR
jgi:hypothetical protein